MFKRGRSRKELAFTNKWTREDTWFPQFNTSGADQYFNTSVCLDGKHPGFFAPGGKNVDNGGNFALYSRTYRINSGHVSAQAGRLILTGNPVPMYCTAGSPEVGDRPGGRMSDDSLTIKGTTAVARSLPTNPSFGVSRAIGELRKDGIPTMVGMQTLKEKSRYLRNSGNEYLNVQFGWLPLVSDLLKFARTVKRSNKIIEQYRRSADTKIKRRYGFPTTDTFWTQTGNMFATAPGDGVYWTGTQTLTSHEVTEFSGAFRYHLPLGDDFASRAMKWESEANKLLGLRLTPSLVWSLAPWSWAADWFGNMGDVMKNVSSLGLDGLAMQYGYISNGITTTETTSAYIDNWVPGRVFTSKTFIEKDLRRLYATPYGFGFDMTALSPAQDAILVALGLSHGLR